jgi:hypothetical protein
MASWVSIIILAVVVGFVLLTIYVWKNKDQILEEAGMELPDLPIFQQLKQQQKHKKKQKMPRMSGKKLAKARR